MEGYERLLTLYSLQDLYIAKPLLEDNEIDYFTTNETAVQINPLSAVATGGVDIFIKKEDLERARLLLTEAGYIEGDISQDIVTNKDENKEKNPEQICPFCGSGNVKSERTKIGMLIGYFIIGLPLPLGIKIYRCFNCRKLFDKNKSQYRYN